MELAFKFSNGTPDFAVTTSMKPLTPIELVVSRTGSPHSQRLSLEAYLHSLEYLFQGVVNYASNDIVGVSISKNWFGKMEKKRDALTWNAVVDKLFLVVYNLTPLEIVERLYVADAFYYDETEKDNVTVKPFYIKELIDRTTKAGKVELEHLVSAVTVATEYVTNYSLVYSSDDKGLTIREKATGDSVTVEDIDNDDDFAIIRFLLSLLNKGMHFGVLFIDARNFSDKTIQAFIEISRKFYGDTFLFLYNCRPDCNVEREVVTLPNFRTGRKPK